MAADDIMDDEQSLILEMTELEAELIQRALKDALTRLGEFAAEAARFGEVAKSTVDVAQGEIEVIEDLLSRLDDQ